MGRADLLIGFGGLHLVLALLLASAAMWIGRRDVALIKVAARAAPLEMRAATDALPIWKLWLLTARQVCLAAEVALIGLVLGWGGLVAAVVGALALWSFANGRARAAVYHSEGRDPLDGGLDGFAVWAIFEFGLVAVAYIAAFSALVFANA
ncbi:hypothetical protein ACFPIF_19520 [Brevundimonas faecalis]|uniref:hypothetical protein n=1 Tax=Brevundimonas faecalis TaxID=947378 RepID=UPI00360DFDB0